MGVSMQKLQAEAPHMVNLVKQAQAASFQLGLDPATNPAAVVATFDSSPSNEMGRNRNYSSGLMSQIGDYVLAAGFTFDDDGEVPFSYFNERAYDLDNVTPSTCKGFVERTYRQYRGGGTSYLAALRWILESVDEFKKISLGRPGDPLEVKFQAPYPVFAIFVTDGEPTDSTSKIRETLIRMSQLPIFIQFVGVGADNNFAFLQSLDDLGGRLIDNAGFFNAMDVLGGKKNRLFGGHSEENKEYVVLEALLNEFPAYYPEARKIGLIA